LLAYSFSIGQGIVINNGFSVNAGRGIDLRNGKIVSGMMVPYASVAEANAATPEAFRYKGLVKLIDDGTGMKEYWYLAGISNGDLVVKGTGGSSYFAGNGLTLSSFTFKADTSILTTQSRTTAGLSLKQNIDFTPTGTGAISRSVESKLKERVSPEDFGASGTGLESDLEPIRAALAHLKTLGGGTLDFKGGATYLIDDTIAIPSYIKINGNRSIIVQTDNTKSIFTFTGETSFIQNSSIDNFILRYQVQASSANHVGAVRMSGENQVSWYLNVTRIVFENCDDCILLPQATGCNNFLTTYRDLTFSSPFGYAMYIYGDANSSGTNLDLENLWTTGFAGYINNTQGIYLRGVGGFRANNIVFERMKGTVLNMETSIGVIDNIYIETLLLGTFGSDRNIIEFINTSVTVASISTFSSTYAATGGNINLVNIQNDFTARNVQVGQIVDYEPVITESGGSAYYVAKCTGTGGSSTGSINYYTSGNTVYDPKTIAVPISNSFTRKLSAGGSITTLKKSKIKGITLVGTSGDIVNIGTTVSGTDILNAVVLDANGFYTDASELYFSTDKVFYISGNSNPVTVNFNL